MRFLKISLILIAACIVIGLWQTWTKRHAKASLEELGSQRLALESEIRQAKMKRAAEIQNLEELRRWASVPPTAPKTPETAPQAAPRSMPSSQSELISTDPKLEILDLKWSRAVVGLEYGPLYRSLGLSSKQIIKFEENYLKHAELSMDLAAVARGKGDAGKETAAVLKQQARSNYEAAQIELLGAEGFRQVEEYIRTLVPRNVFVLGLAGAAAFEGVPLTAQQGDQLWQAAIKASRTDSSAKGSELIAAVDWDALDAQAEQILTPAQLELFKNVAPPSGFESRPELKAKDVIRRAQEADTAAARTSATK
jgi:hypothetical protein